MTKLEITKSRTVCEKFSTNISREQIEEIVTEYLEREYHGDDEGMSEVSFKWPDPNAIAMGIKVHWEYNEEEDDDEDTNV